MDTQRKEIEKFHDKNVDLNDPQTIENFKSMEMYNRKKKTDEDDAEKKLDSQTLEDHKEDLWLLSHSLKIDRIRQRVLLDAEKQAQTKSQGEVALMFSGLNRIAYDLLLENPMAGYMNQVVFTRVLGQSDEIDGAEVWKDCNQCWICEKWKKTRIEYYSDYKSYMR